MAANWDVLMVSSVEDSAQNVISTVLGPDGDTSLSSFGDGQFSPDDEDDNDNIKSEDEDIILADLSHGTPVLSVQRKSDRERRERRSFSPETLRQLNKGRRRKGIPRKLASTEKCKDVDKVCDLCLSNSLPKSRGASSKKINQKKVWKTKVDPNTGKVMLLCNTCVPTFYRQTKEKKAKPPPPIEEKEKYLEDAQAFADSLVQELGDQDAERLACPHFKNRGCGCLQRYILGDGITEESRKRASELLELLKKAKELSQKKYYDPATQAVVSGKSKRSRIGLGNGQKRSKEFEDFVLENRQVLRDTLMLCERATQRVLMYSNNFLHKKLKTESRSCRVERKKGKLAMGLLKPVVSLVKETCCADRCVRVAVTLSGLLMEWRERAATGQMEARRVIAEMLTPSGGARANCYKFIAMVTGCSFSTIGKVNDQMRKSGGVREPPTHGMCKYWEKNPHKKKSRGNSSQPPQSSVATPDLECHQEDQTCFSVNDDLVNAAVTTVTIEPTSSSSEAASATLVLEQFQNQTTIPDSLVHVDTPMEVTESPAPAPDKEVQNTQNPLSAHKNQIFSLQKQLAQQQIQLQQQQQLIQQQLLHQVLLDQTTAGSSGVHLQTLQSLQQLLNLQQQYQQQQLQQLNQLQEQAGMVVTPGESLPPVAQNGQITGGLETLQLHSSQNLAQLLQSTSDQPSQEGNAPLPQSVVLLQTYDAQQQQQILQQQQQQSVVLQNNTEAAAVLGTNNGGIQTVVEQVTEEQMTETTVTPDAIVSETTKGASIESVVTIPMPGSSGSSVILPTSAFIGKGNVGSTTNTQAVIPQIIDLGQLNVGIQSINSTPGQVFGSDVSQFLSNYNITLLPQQPVASTSITNTAAVSTNSNTTAELTDIANNANSIWSADNETLTQLLASNLGCTVLAIEPSVLNQSEGANTATTSTVTSTDKSTPEHCTMFVDFETPGAVCTESTAESVKREKCLQIVGKETTGTDSGESSGQGEMSASDVLQLLSGITIIKSDSDT